MPTIIKKLGIKKKKGYFYYLDKKGDLVQTKMNRCGPKGKKGCKTKPNGSNKNVSEFVDGLPNRFVRSRKKYKTARDAWSDISKKTGLKSTQVTSKHSTTQYIFIKK